MEAEPRLVPELVRAFSVSVLLTTGVAVQATGQDATLTGVVRSVTDEEPLANVLVTLNNGRMILTDSAGGFTLDAVESGTSVLSFRRIGYQSVELAVWVPSAGEVATIAVELEALAVELDDITVVGEEVPRHLALEGFPERRLMGLGRFLTRSEIEDKQLQRPSDLVRDWPRRFRGICTLFVDGILVEIDFLRRGDALAALNELVSLSQIDAVEAYAGPSTVPSRFQVMHEGCNAATLVVWLR